MKQATLDATVRHYDHRVPTDERVALATRLHATRTAIAIGDQPSESNAFLGTVS